MALPSSRRPVDIENEWPSVSGQGQNGLRVSLKLKVNKLQVFYDTMASWYRNKSAKQKKKLMKRDVVGRAKTVSKNLGVEYTKLPPTWLRTLHEKHGVDFRWHDPAVKAKLVSFYEISLRCVAKRVTTIELFHGDDECLQIAIKKIKQAGMGGKIEGEEMVRKIEEVKSGVVPAADVIREFSEDNGRSRIHEEREYIELDELKSKFVDLTKAPPPDYWTSAYIKGIHLPRELKVTHLDDSDQVVIYYDYEPKTEVSRIICLLLSSCQ